MKRSKGNGTKKENEGENPSMDGMVYNYTFMMNGYAGYGSCASTGTQNMMDGNPAAGILCDGFSGMNEAKKGLAASLPIPFAGRISERILMNIKSGRYPTECYC